jgi:hypothetical protein
MMAIFEYELASPPSDPRALELWLQHAAGFILFEDARRYAIDELGPNLSEDARVSAQKAIDDAIYGVMMILDGVSGGLSNDTERVEFQVTVKLVDLNATENSTMAEVDLANGDGMCMGYHGWMEGDFGDNPVAIRR